MGSEKPSHKCYAENSNQFQMPVLPLLFILLLIHRLEKNGCMNIKKMVSQISRFSNMLCCDCCLAKSNGIFNDIFVALLAIVASVYFPLASS